MDWRQRARAFRRVERILLGFAFLFLSVYFAARIDSAVASRAELRRFWKAQETSVTGGAVNTSSQNGEHPNSESLYQ